MRPNAGSTYNYKAPQGYVLAEQSHQLQHGLARTGSSAPIDNTRHLQQAHRGADDPKANYLKQETIDEYNLDQLNLPYYRARQIHGRTDDYRPRGPVFALERFMSRQQDLGIRAIL